MKKLTFAIAMAIISLSTNAQTNWQKGGNANTPGGAPSTIGTDASWNAPLNFITVGTQRMTITPTGLVGISNGLAPLSLLHINSSGNPIGGEVFRTSGPGANLNAWRMYTGAGNGTERMRLSTFVNNNVFLQSTTANALLGFRTGDAGTAGIRSFFMGQNDLNETSGYMAVGNNLNQNFVPLDRLHLHQSAASQVKLRFTYQGFASLGSNIGIEDDASFRLTQFENQNTSIFTPSNLTAGTQAERFRIAANGQVFVGSPILAENVIDNAPVDGFSQLGERSALLNVNGPIFSAYTVSAAFPVATVLYGYTNPAINSTPNAINDGFRIKMDQNFFGANADALVFEKTDGNQNDVDGGIAFTNTGAGNNQLPSFYIRGTGRTYVGQAIFSSFALQNRFVIDSEPGDASLSGLRFIDLTSAETPEPNPGDGVLSVDENGNVIYVPGGGTFAGAENGTSVNALDRVVLGQTPGDPLNPGRLLDNREIPLNTFDINFSRQGALHLSQGSATLNPNAAFDLNNQNSNKAVGYYFNGFNGSNNANLKGFFGEMNLNNNAVANNSALLELSNTEKSPDSKGWLIKANGYYGVLNTPVDLADQASFGVLGNGNVMINGNMSATDFGKANFVVNDIPGAANTFLGGRRSMYVSSTHAQGSINFGLDVLATNDVTSVTGMRSTAQGTNNSSSATGISSEASSSSTNAGAIFGVQGTASSSSGAQRTFGVQGFANGSAVENTAVRGDAISPTTALNFGISGLAQNSTTSNVGVLGLGTGTAGMKNYGVSGRASGGSLDNYSIYGEISSGSGNLYAGYFQGFTYVNGDLEVNGHVNSVDGSPLTSDASLKTNIGDIQNASAILSNLHPRSFYFDTVNPYGFNFNGKKQYGFIAQELEQFLPELVSEQNKRAQYDSAGNVLTPAYNYKALNYNAFFGILAQAAKEQQTQIDEQQSELQEKDSVIASQQAQLNDLNSRLSQLENCLSALLPILCEANQMAVQQTPQEIQRELSSKLQVKLSDKNTIVLAQNVPNPFAESTVIAYSIPLTVKQAQIHFYNSQGNLIQSVDITERGNGELTVFADDLSSGMYTYSLVADGKVAATKKMVKQ